MQEVELKFIDINIEEIKKKITDLGAKKTYEKDMENLFLCKEGFDFRDSSKKILRLRKTNDSIVLNYKGPNESSQMHNKEEIEIQVDDLEKTISLFERLEFTKTNILKKHREHYEMDDVHFEFDTVEDIPTYLEIETQSEKAMIDICKKLDLDITKGQGKNVFELFPDELKDFV